ncbi:hypothetical protein HK096_007314, partial [Nowakowskiella sp. JEL0078]
MLKAFAALAVGVLVLGCAVADTVTSVPTLTATQVSLVDNSSARLSLDDDLGLLFFSGAPLRQQVGVFRSFSFCTSCTSCLFLLALLVLLSCTSCLSYTSCLLLQGFLFLLAALNSSSCSLPQQLVADPHWLTASWIAIIPSNTSCSDASKLDVILQASNLGSRLVAAIFINPYGSRPSILSPIKSIPVYNAGNATSSWLLSHMSTAFNANSRVNINLTPPPLSDIQSPTLMQFTLGGVILVLAISFLVSIFLHMRNRRIFWFWRRHGSEIPAQMLEFDSQGREVMDLAHVESLPIRTWKRTKNGKPGTKVYKLNEYPMVHEKKLLGFFSSSNFSNVDVSTTPKIAVAVIPVVSDGDADTTITRPSINTTTTPLHTSTSDSLPKITTHTVQPPSDNLYDEYDNKNNGLTTMTLPQSHSPTMHPSMSCAISPSSNHEASIEVLERRNSIVSAISTAISAVGADTCAVCMEDYLDGDMLRELPYKWLTSRSIQCPLCKQEAGPVAQGMQNIYINAFRYTYYDDNHTINGDGEASSGAEESERRPPWYSLDRNTVSISFPPPTVRSADEERPRPSRHFLRFAPSSQVGRGERSRISWSLFGQDHAR